MAAAPGEILVEGVSKRFGEVAALGSVSLHVRPGEFLTLVGPSGCGKSTLLRIIAGLEEPTSGSVSIDGRVVDGLRPKDRRIAMMFQSYALYPHMSAFDNIAMPLTMARLTLAERLPLLRLLSPRRRRVMNGIAAEVRAVAQQLQIESLLERKPAQLSGGQRQRVALGRAMIRRPSAFLLDEPLSNLDAKLRVHMRGELAALHRRLGATFVYVTHDQVEAMTLSDRVALVDAGDILQIGTPVELYDTPTSIRAAQFIGSPPINLLPITADHQGRLVHHGAAWPAAVSPPARDGLTAGVRPEALRPVAHGLSPDGIAMEARLERVEHLGGEYVLHAVLPSSDSTPILCRLSAGEHAQALEAGAIGPRLILRTDPRYVHVFDRAGLRIPTDPLSAPGLSQGTPIGVRGAA